LSAKEFSVKKRRFQ